MIRTWFARAATNILASMARSVKAVFRTFMKVAGLLPMIAPQPSGASAQVKPRHVLCLLGTERRFDHAFDCARGCH